MNSDVSNSLPLEPTHSEFFSVVRAIERAIWHSRSQSAENKMRSIPRWWTDADSALALVRFEGNGKLDFPASEVTGVIHQPRPSKADEEWTVSVAFFGLTGAVGTLPLHLTCQTIDIGDVDRSAFRDFLAIFDNRAIAFFYRAWERRRWVLRLERARNESREGAAAEESTDPITRMLDGLLGVVAAPKYVWGNPICRDLPRYYASAFSSFRRPFRHLTALLAEVLGLKVSIKDHVGQWQVISDSMRTRLGRESTDRYSEDDTRNSQLGHKACVGNRVWMCQGNFRVTIGPMNEAQFSLFFPPSKRADQRDGYSEEGPWYRFVVQTVRMYVGPLAQFWIQPLLSSESVPRCEIRNVGSVHLGRNCWIGQRRLTLPAHDAVFRVANAWDCVVDV